MFLDEVSTDAQTAYLMYKPSIGYFLSIHVRQDPDMVNYIAVGSGDSPEIIRIQTARFHFAIPRSYFLPVENAIESLRYFCETGLPHPTQQWVRYEDLGFNMYAIE